MKLTQLVAVSAIALFSSASAYAADMVAPSQPVYSWAGGYVGIQGGYGWTSASFGDDAFRFKENLNGGLFGLHGGYNFQNGNFVYGLEGDITYNWNKTGAQDFLAGLEFGTDWQGTVRARAGYAVDRTLFYGTAGIAFTNSYIKIPMFSGLKQTEAFTGFTVGAGVEHAFADKWTARLEYRYTDFGKREVGGIFTGMDAKLKQQSVLAGISYKF